MLPLIVSRVSGLDPDEVDCRQHRPEDPGQSDSEMRRETTAVMLRRDGIGYEGFEGFSISANLPRAWQARAAPWVTIKRRSM